jgi:hypothetical protein
MVKWIFENPYIKRNYEQKLKDIWRRVITAPTPDLTIKVIYPKPRCWYEPMRYCLDRSNTNMGSYTWHKQEAMYASLILHYPFEEMTIVRAGDCDGSRGRYCHRWSGFRLIKLFYTEGTSDYWIAFIMAHEYRHYRQYKRYGEQMHQYENGRLHRPIQLEKDANGWAHRRVTELGFKRT